MRINEVILCELKKRIEHPEDLIFMNGSAGAKSAVDSLLAAATKPEVTSLKLDGSPALLCGRDGNGVFTLTDKIGFSKHKIGGLPETPKKLYNMLFQRKPDQEGRSAYSKSVADLFIMLKKAIPETFRGYIQFDVMFFTRPQLVNGEYAFTPNKVTYHVPEDSDLGQKIKIGNTGIAIHSYFKSPEQNEPVAVKSIESLHLNPIPQLVLIPATMSAVVESNDIEKACKDTKKYIMKYASQIDKFFDAKRLAELGIETLPGLMKSFLARQASTGKPLPSNLGSAFDQYLIENGRKTKIPIMQQYINKNVTGFQIVWGITHLIVNIKYQLLKQLNGIANSLLSASIGDVKSHEGFVSDTPHGRIKLVDRPVFMNRNTSSAVRKAMWGSETA